MPYIQRNESGAIVGRFANRQPNIAEEWLDDNSPELTLTSYDEELTTLSNSYQKDVDSFNKLWATALLADGPNEVVKLAAIRAQYIARKDKYSADYAALRNKYQK